jgi:prevent-host-death family protein
MPTVGIRLLQQHASKALRRVRQGETLTITDRGRPIAVITPAAEASCFERLHHAGRLIKAEGDVLEVSPIRRPRGGVAPSSRLRDMRAHER